jgi:hypothetical protein
VREPAHEVFDKIGARGHAPRLPPRPRRPRDHPPRVCPRSRCAATMLRLCGDLGSTEAPLPTYI